MILQYNIRKSEILFNRKAVFFFWRYWSCSHILKLGKNLSRFIACNSIMTLLCDITEYSAMEIS
jgi:hypothetical protein